MIQKLLLILSAIFIFSGAFAQDIIVLKDKNEISCTIQEISTDSIKFIPTRSSNGAWEALSKKDVVKVIFSNGIEEFFGGNTHSSDYYYDKKEGGFSEKQPGVNTPYDRIYMMDGTYIDGQVLEKKRFGINYVRYNAPGNEISYIANTKVAKIVYADGTVEYISGSAYNESSRKVKKSPRDFSYLSPHFVSVDLGPSLPFGIYSSVGGLGGFAGLGMNINTDFTYYLFRGMGFSAYVGGSFNSFNDEILRNYVATNNEFPNAQTSVGDWWHAYTMLGLGYYNDFGRVIIDYKALAGAMYSFFPSTEIKYMDGQDQMLATLNSKAISFAFGANTSIRYFLTRKLSVKGSLTLLFGRPQFPGITRKTYKNGEAFGEQLENIPNFSGVFEQQVSIINFSVGVAYTIGP